ncbi:MAG: CDP-alcohol phosphatidyltransferase family protein [Chloroflexi bacterium]|nr:CDP-alcohol phosphatidyltransferase family protein [Chloroflexota bacterium]
MKTATAANGDRRPIPARETRWARAVAGWLVRSRVSPNAVSLAGMAAALLAGLALAGTGFEVGGAARRLLWFAAGGLIVVRLLANMFDGLVAVEGGRATRVGQLYNEIPDRISDLAVLAGAGFASGGGPLLGLAAGAMAVFVAYVRAAARVAGAPSDFSGPMAKPQRMWLIVLAVLYLAIAPGAWQPAWGPGGNWGLIAAALAVIIGGGTFTAARRLVRAARALRTE